MTARPSAPAPAAPRAPRARSTAATAVAAALAAALAGCGQGQDSSVGVKTTEVRGSVAGVVLDAGPGLAPLAGVSVLVVAGSFTASTTTDASGLFVVANVPSGSVVVRLSEPRHFDVYLRGLLDGAAGNFPLQGPTLTLGPVALLANSGAFKVRLVDEAGAPAPGIRVTARTSVGYLDLSSGAATSTGVLEAAATTAADGLATITPLPDFGAIGPLANDALTVSIPPVQVQGSETYAYLGADLAFNGRRVSSQTPTVVLAGPHTAVQVISSSLDYLQTGTTTSQPSLVSPAGPITVTFNQAIGKDTVRAILYGEGGDLAPVQPTPTVAGNNVRLDLGATPLATGARYNLQLHVASLANQAREYNVLAPVFTRPDPNAAVSATLALDPGNASDVIVTFSEPVGVGNGSSSPIGCVVFYEADLDGNLQVTSAGEWNPKGNASLRCVPGDPAAGHYLRPDEPSFAGQLSASAITGFSTRFRLTVRPSQAVCIGGYQCCVLGAPVHFVLGRNPDSNAVLRRTSGQPLPDLLNLMMPGGC